MKFLEAVNNFKKLAEVRKNFAKFLKFANNLTKFVGLANNFYKGSWALEVSSDLIILIISLSSK